MPENEYLPYKAINIFMERDYLEQVINEILQSLQTLPKEDQLSFTNQFRKYVNVLGFRNPVRAPLSLRVKAHVSAFEEKDEVIPFTLTTWAKLKQDFAKQVQTWLKEEGWENLTYIRTFTETEGFRQEWPENLTFDQIEEKYRKANPDHEISRDDLILMVLWTTGCLPKEQSDL